MVEEYDILIKNASIVDGTGSPAYRGAVAVKGERLAVVGKVEGDLKVETEVVIDAEGLVVSPGFIDVHNHGDLSILYYPDAESFVRQGITTFVGGQCGNSPGPFGEYIGLPWILGDIYSDVVPKMYTKDWLVPRDLLNSRHKSIYGWEIDWYSLGEFFKRVEEIDFGPNYVPLVGHGDVRSLVMGLDFKRKATKKEIREMRKHIRQAMDDGCRGLSVGRDYDPGIWAGFEEILACAKIAAMYRGIYVCHSLRTGHREARRPGEFPPVKTKGVIEALDVGRKAKISVQISHLSSIYDVTPSNSELMTEASVKATLKIIDDAREDGIDVNFDVIPNNLTGGISTSPWLVSYLTPWLRVTGSLEQLALALLMPDFRDEIKEIILSGKHYGLNPNINPNWANQRTIVECEEESFLQKKVSEVAELLGLQPLDALLEILSIDPKTKAVRMGGDDRVKLMFFRHPDMMIGIDTFGVDDKRISRHPPWRLPNENSYGGFPRYLKRAVRETATLTIEEAVRKITSSPARKFKLTDRGVLRSGAYADIVVFNPETVTDRGNQLNPRQYPDGIEHVIINGTLIVKKTKHTGARPGKILYRE